MNKHRIFLGLALAGFFVLTVPNPIVDSVVAENPTTANVYAGDAHAIAANAIGDRHLGFRIVSDSNNPSHRAGWEIAPGASVTVYFRHWCPNQCFQMPSGDAADYCKLRTYWDNTATVQRSFYDSTTCPASGTAYTLYCTHDGTSTGTATSGTIRLRVEARESTAGVPVYTADSDALDRGAIRCGSTISNIATNAYPSGSTFASTVAGENIQWSVGITPSSSSQLRTWGVVALDSAGNIPPGFGTATTTATADSASFTTANFVVSDAWPAASDTYGLRVSPVGNSPLTGVKWTHLVSATLPVILDSDSQAHRPTFFAVDPRITATHLLQVNNAAFGTPPMANDVGDLRTLPDIGYYATRFTNARGEGLSGATFAYSRTLQDNGAVLPPDSLVCASSCIGTQGGEAGWSPLFVWNAGGPIGQWNKLVDVTGPSTIDSNAHLINAAETLFLELPDSGETVVNITEEMGDPLKVFAVFDESSGLVKLTISESYLNGNARIGNALGTFVYVYRPDDSLFLDAVNPTEIQFGSYRYSFEPDVPGPWLVLVRTMNETGVPVGTSNLVEVDSMTNEVLDAVNAWAPMIIALAILAIGASREKVNLTLVGISGMFLLWASWSTPLGNIALRTVASVFALYLIVEYLLDENEKLKQRRAAKKAKSEALYEGD